MSRIDQARASAGRGSRVPENIARAVNEYVLFVADKIGAPEWLVVVNDDPPISEDATATMNSRGGAKFAGIWLSDRFLDPNDPTMSDELRTQALIHECVHLLFEGAWHFFDTFTEENLPKPLCDLAQFAFKTHMEYGVDQLAWALLQWLPGFALPKPEV